MKHIRALAAVAVLLANTLPTTAQPADQATVLLVTSEELAPAWKRFADWKTQLGRPTKVVTTEAIAKAYKGADHQARIRAAILDHIDRYGTRWVILGGDSQPGGKGIVPDRDTVHSVMGGRLRYADIPTDLYYISPKDWDANDDGVYGEWAKDKDEVAYTHPKGVAIGRIPVRSAADIGAYTDKVIAYETRYPESGFARKMVYTNTVNHSQPKVERSWDDYISPAWKDGKAYRFFHTKTPWDKDKPGDYPLTSANWAKLINDRTAGKMHMHGHGFLPVWVLEGRSAVTGRTVAQLKNTDAYLVMTTVSCFTGQFDSPKDPSITETMLRAPERGAVIILAPSREGVPIFHRPQDMRLMVTEGKLDGTTQTHTRFWTHGLSKPITAGEAFMAAKADMTADAKKTAGYHWCQSEINFLGDPTLDLRAKDPTTPKLEVPASIKVGQQALAIKTAPKMTVCIWKSDEVYHVAQAGPDGTLNVKIAPTSTGKISVTASGPSINAVEKTITVK